MKRTRWHLARPWPGKAVRLALLGLAGASCAGFPFWNDACASTVQVRLASPQDGAVLAPGAPIEWSIEVQASSGDNAGLALISLDLVQSDDNPAPVDLPPAGEVPAGMRAFSRPLGISNPGEGGRETGYTGVQRGAAGARNLVQIGGAQNTTGLAGTRQGQNTAVTPGVAQDGFILIARGSFAAPAAPGVYAYAITNAIANTLIALREAPAASRVEPAQVAFELASFAFTVEATARCQFGCFIRGDCNGDGQTTSVTDAVFLLQHSFLGGRTPPCLAACDIDGDGGDGTVTDAILLLQFNFLGGRPPPAPFPRCGESSRPSDAQIGCIQSQENCP
jgi:hypothetical protein